MLNLKFINVEDGLPEEYFRIVFVVKCPLWNEEGFQVCTFNGTEFEFDGQSNDMFMDTIESWAILFHDEF